ncbi:MAG: translocation/assembly module TamB domain-containing protein [Pseudomonadota bacterium]
MAWRWPSARLWRRLALGAFIVIAATVIFLRLFAMSSIAHNMAEARIEAMTLRGQAIELDGVHGDLLGRAEVDRLIIRDADGIWLEATNVSMSWAPLAFFRQHLKTNEVSAAHINLTRRPALAPATGRSSAIQRVTVGALNITDLSLADGVAGPAQSYALIGQLYRHRQTGSVELDLAPRSHDGDRIHAALDWGGDIPLRGRVEVSGASNGLIAALAQTPDGAAISGDLSAEGTLKEWTLVANADVGDAPALDINLRRESGTYAGQGQLALSAFGTLRPLQARLGDSLRFDGSIAPDQSASVSIEADTLSAHATGQVTWRTDDIQIDRLVGAITRADAQSLTGFSDLTLPALTLEGALTLSAQIQAFNGAVAIPRVTYRDYTGEDVRSDGRIRLTDARVEIESDLTVARLTGLPDAVTPLMSGAASLQLHADYNRSDGAARVITSAFKNRATEATAQGTLQSGGDLALAGTFSTRALPDIAMAEGAWSVSGQRAEDVQLKIAGDLIAARDAETLFALFGDRAELDLTMLRNAERVVLETASLTTPELRATATGRVSDGIVSGRSQIQAASLSVGPGAFKSLNADLALTGRLVAPEINLSAQIAEVIYAGQAVSNLNIASSGSLRPSSDFSIVATAGYLDEPFDLKVTGRRSADTFIIEDLAANWDALTATGTGTLRPQTLSASELQIDVSGSFAGFDEINANLGYQNQDLVGLVALQDSAFGPVTVDQATVNLSGHWPRFTGEITYQADVETPGGTQPIFGMHGLHANLETRAFELDGAATLADQTIAFVSPLIISLESGLHASGQVMAFGGQIDIDLKPLVSAQSTLRAANISVQSLAPLLNRPALLGRLDAQASLGLAEGQLTGMASGAIVGLTRGISNTPATNLILEGAIEENVLSATLATEENEHDLNFVGRATVPLQHSGSLLSIRPIPGAAMPVAIRGDGPIEPLWALAAPTDLRVEGHATVDIHNGAGDTWRFNGPLQLADGVFEDGITGLHLTDINIDAALRPDGIAIESAHASGRRSGRVDASGSYKFDGSGSVTMTLNRLNALNRSDFSATVSGMAEIDRQKRRTSITGDLEVDQARVNLEKLPRAGYTTLDVVFSDDVNSVDETPPAREAIALNLDITADRRIFVTGSGVDTEWGVAARVTGSPGRPDIIGRANLIRGEADLLSRRFRFSDGQVRFVGDPLATQLLIRADRTSDDVTSTITLAGSLTDPEISLSSDPALPNDEILSRALFGRSPSELSPLQAAQLAGAAAQLAGGDALNLVGQLQEATGLDRLDIGLDNAGSATLSTGKYLSEDIYLEIESGVTGAPGVALEWTPLDNVAVDAEIDPEVGPKVAIQWKRDFDRLPGEPDPE